MDNLESLKRILDRERKARKQAEQIIEQKSRELFTVNTQLKNLNDSLEDLVSSRTTELNKKIEELNNSNKYKSEFLANMSHELRTPLNSILILARMLKDNRENNLTSKQVEYASVVLHSGQDLLTLINDILDLAKIEAGRSELNYKDVSIVDIKQNLFKMFEGISKEKNIDFNIRLSPALPGFIKTDKTKLLQVLRNLLSNSFKFTDPQGDISLDISIYKKWLIYSVKDSGIGIEKEKLEMIFEAFQQADGSTSRKYGGTGLGLSISRELIQLMNGHIVVESDLGVGTTFQISVPLDPSTVTSEILHTDNSIPILKTDIYNKIDTIQKGADSEKRENLPLLIIEDDTRFLKILQDYAEEKGIKTKVATQGDTGLYFAKKFKPMAILLDIQLPIMSGWEVLKELKNDPELSHIPVHIFSIIDKPNLGITMGAESYNIKPINIADLENTFKTILQKKSRIKRECMILGKDSKVFPRFYQALQSYFSNVRFASNYTIAVELAREKDFGTIIMLNNDLEGMNFNAFIQILDKIHNEKSKKIKIYVPNKYRLQSDYTNHQFLKIISDEKKLMEDFKIELTEPETVEATLSNINDLTFLYGCKILLVEDEIRNVFVLDSLLEPNGVQLTVANNGQEALNELKKDKNFDIILMDVMMPIMNGYEAIKHIRSNPETSHLKIIAVTAKAMKGDKEKCIEAGADAYLSKPIEIEDLYAKMKKMIV